MSGISHEKREPWAWVAFALGLTTAALLVFLGCRPGGAAAVLAYSWGPLILGSASAVGLLLALLWCLRRRPVLQRGRTVPLVVLAASLWVCSLPIAYPSSHERNPSSIRFRLPFEGEALVRFGGGRGATNPLLFDPGRRFGIVFEPVGEDALSVLAPCGSRVLELGTVGPDETYLTLEVGDDQFLVLSGLAPGSCEFRPGDTIVEGAALGRALERLVVHLQDGPRRGRSEGIPLRFWSYLADGRPAEVGVPIPPQRVARAQGGS